MAPALGELRLTSAMMLTRPGLASASRKRWLGRPARLANAAARTSERSAALTNAISVRFVSVMAARKLVMVLMPFLPE